MKSEKELKIKFKALLNELDTETQIYGCRVNNSAICGNVYLENICAFAVKIIYARNFLQLGKDNIRN